MQIIRISQSCANKLDNLEEMYKLLETYTPPRLDQEGTDNLNTVITSTEIKSVITTLLTNKVKDQVASQGNFSKHIKS